MALATREIEKPKEQEIEIIQTDNWDLPVCNLGTGKYAWRPGTAYLPYFLLEGPEMSRRTHGINLDKDLLIGVHGPRGATKTLTVSFLIAKKMRMGMPAWTNWPISFWVIEPDCWDKCNIKNPKYCAICKRGHKTYYESFPLNFDKLYTFNSEISDGACGITELQYYAESRTSGRGQNRMLSYQLMQIRKSAMSFFYDVQNPRWADNRFSWSDDVKIFCRDLAKMNYDLASVGHEIQEGEYSHWMIRDISGVLTGVQYEESQLEYGPYQFDGFNFWHIYPTRWKIDVYEAVYSMQQQSEKADKDAAVGKGIQMAVDFFLDEGKIKVMAAELWAKAKELSGIAITPEAGGKVLAAYNIERKQKSGGKYCYDLSPFLNQGAEVEK